MLNAMMPTTGRTVWRDCPSCGYKKSLSLSVGEDGRELFYCHAGCSQGDLLRVMRGGMPPRHRPPPDPTQRAARESVKAFAAKLWQESQDGRDSLVPVYLASRGLIGPVPATLHFLPEHLHKPSGTRWPCVIAAVMDHLGQVQAIHRTYLAHDGKGKAPVEPQKMTLGPVGGFAIHLGAVGEKLVVAEGVETALSVQFATGTPAWSAISAGGIRNLILPPLPLAVDVVVAADGDAVGRTAAHDAATRWRREGRRVRIALAPEGKDFNDVLREDSI